MRVGWKGVPSTPRTLKGHGLVVPATNKAGSLMRPLFAPPVSYVNFIGDGGAELVFDEDALDGIRRFEVVDEGLSK